MRNEGKRRSPAVTLVSVVGEYTDVLPHMLAHYRSIGVRHFSLHAHAPSCGHPSLRRIAAFAREAGTAVASVSTGEWIPGNNTALYAAARADRPNDWFLLADHDELQVYPAALKDVLRYCDQKGYDYIEGCLIDRVAESGELRTVSRRQSIWKQFPMGTMVSATVMGAVVNKVVAARGHVRISTGQHRALSGVGCPPAEVYVPVHHFKWVKGLAPRLAARSESVHQRTGLYALECSRFAAYYARYGRMRLEDPVLLSGRCDPDYPYWDMVQQWRIAAPFFSPELAVQAMIGGV